MMNDAPIRLFDILPMVDHSSHWAQLLVIALTVLFTLSLVLWYYYFTPLAKLQCALSNRSLTPRQVCHQLAGMATKKGPFLQQLNRLRFQPTEPTRVEVQAVLKRARHVL